MGGSGLAQPFLGNITTVSGHNSSSHLCQHSINMSYNSSLTSSHLHRQHLASILRLVHHPRQSLGVNVNDVSCTQCCLRDLTDLWILGFHMLSIQFHFLPDKLVLRHFSLGGFNKLPELGEGVLSSSRSSNSTSITHDLRSQKILPLHATPLQQEVLSPGTEVLRVGRLQ